MLRVLGNRVLLQRSEATRKTESGLYIPDTAQKRSGEAVVKAVGTEVKSGLSIGDRVMFNHNAGFEIPDGLLVREDDIYLVLD